MTCARTSRASRRPGLRPLAQPEAELRRGPEHRGGRRVGGQTQPHGVYSLPAACKAVNAGSIPTPASMKLESAETGGGVGLRRVASGRILGRVAGSHDPL